jgi:NADH-quinone oxidoreductase subunit I
MPVEPKDVQWVEDPKLGLLESMYLPAIWQGIKTTIGHAFEKKVTEQYPEQRPDSYLPDHYRGVHRLNRDDKGRVKCVACFLCSTACPAHCISIVAQETDKSDPTWSDRDKFPKTFVIDELRCIYCGMCEEACPVDAIELTSLYHLSALDSQDKRSQFLYDREKLLEVYDITVTQGKDPVRTKAGKLGPASDNPAATPAPVVS